MDANTDPDFYGPITGYFGNVMRVVFGQLLSEGEAQTTYLPDGTALLAQSAFNLLVRPGNEVLTVVAGQVSVAGDPQAPVPGGTQVAIAGGRIVSRRVVSPEELGQITAWRRQYTFFQPGPAPYPAPQPYPPTAPRRYYPYPVPPSYWPGQDRGYRQPAPPGDGRKPIIPVYPSPTPGGVIPGTLTPSTPSRTPSAPSRTPSTPSRTPKVPPDETIR